MTIYVQGEGLVSVSYWSASHHKIPIDSIHIQQNIWSLLCNYIFKLVSTVVDLLNADLPNSTKFKK